MRQFLVSFAIEGALIFRNICWFGYQIFIYELFLLEGKIINRIHNSQIIHFLYQKIGKDFFEKLRKANIHSHFIKNLSLSQTKPIIFFYQFFV